MHNTNPAHLCRVTVPLLHLKAAALFAPKNDIRYYLKGVHIEATGTKVYAVATCGAALAALHSERGDSDIGSGCLIVPSEVIADIAKKLPKTLREVTFRRLAEHTDGAPNSIPGPGRWDVEQLDSLGCGITFKAVDGRYPDRRRVLPANPTGEAAQLNPEYLTKFDKAAKLLGTAKTHPVVIPSGAGAALVAIEGHPLAGVVMPLRMPQGWQVPSASSVISAFAG